MSERTASDVMRDLRTNYPEDGRVLDEYVGRLERYIQDTMELKRRTPAAQDAAQGREVVATARATGIGKSWVGGGRTEISFEGVFDIPLLATYQLVAVSSETTPATPTTNSGEIGRKSVGDAQRLRELIGQYWDIAYQEGREGRSTDNEAGDASRVSLEIETVLRRLSRREG